MLIFCLRNEECIYTGDFGIYGLCGAGNCRNGVLFESDMGRMSTPDIRFILWFLGAMFVFAAVLSAHFLFVWLMFALPREWSIAIGVVIIAFCVYFAFTDRPNRITRYLHTGKWTS